MKHNYSKSLLPLMILVSLGLIWIPESYAKVFNVSNTSDVGDDTLRAAIDEANLTPGQDIVQLEPGTYTLDSGSGALVITDDLTIKGSSAENTIIDGNRNHRVFFIDGAIKVDITKVTITNGEDAGGAGIFNQGSKLTITDCTIAGNNAFIGSFRSGGGIHNESGDVTIRHSTIFSNFAAVGGGLSNISNDDKMIILDSLIVSNGAEGIGAGIANSGEMTIQNSLITRDGTFGGFGGGIWNFGKMTIINTTITDSLVQGGWGGGIFNRGDMSIYRSTIANNSASLGGGIYNQGGDVAIYYSIITQNFAGGFGGGIYNEGGNVIITNGTVTDNTANEDGGGIFNDGGKVSLKKTAVEGNLPNDCVGCP